MAGIILLFSATDDFFSSLFFKPILNLNNLCGKIYFYIVRFVKIDTAHYAYHDNSTYLILVHNSDHN